MTITKYAIVSMVFLFLNGMVIAPSVPLWGSSAVPTVSLFGSDCLEVRWTKVDDDGGAPILCYEVERGDDSVWYTMVDCGLLAPGEMHARSCGFSNDVDINFKVVAINSEGSSVVTHSSNALRWDWLVSLPDSLILDPASGSSRTSSDVPTILVRSYFRGAQIDTISTDKVFVAQLVGRCKLELYSQTITVPVEVGDPSYVATTGVLTNIEPVFTQKLLPVPGVPGLYSYTFSSTQYVLAGEYTLFVSSLEPGGLLGQYWSNPFFDGGVPPDLERKDECIDFNWDQNPVLEIAATGVLMYDLVSIRWTGWLAAQFREEYTFTVQTLDYVQIWIDEVLVLDQLITPCVAGVCSFDLELKGLGEYHHVRVDYYHSKGFAQETSAGITLRWSSYSQPDQVIPATAWYKSLYIEASDPSDLLALTFVPDIISGPHCQVTYPSEAVAGVSFAIIVQSRDVYDQDRRTISEMFYVQLTSVSNSVYGTTVAFDPPNLIGKYTVDVTVLVAGSYALTIVDGDGNTINGDTWMEITVHAADPVSANVDHVNPSPSLLGNSPISVWLVLRDAYSNIISFDDIVDELPSVYVSAEWQYDTLSLARLGGSYVDLDAMYPPSSAHNWEESVAVWDTNEDLFKVEIILLLSGEYTVEISVNSNAVSQTLAWTVHANPNQIIASNSVIVKKPFPPTLSSNVAYTMRVQLRDSYWGVIDLPHESFVSVSLGGVFVRILSPRGEEGGSACVADNVIVGQYICTILPEFAGLVNLSVLVNGQEASYIPSQALAPAVAISGPFSITVLPGAVMASACIFSGYSTMLVAGIYQDTVLTLRDFWNNDAPNSVMPTVEVNFLVLPDRTDVAYTIDSSTFVLNPLDNASILIPFGSDLVSPSGGWGLEVLVDGSPVSIASSTIITVLPGLAKAANSVCSDITNTQVAGVAFTRICTPKDSTNNDVDRDGLFLTCSYKNQEGPPLTIVNTDGVYIGTTYFLSTTLIRSGSYSAYCWLRQQGGLVAEYFGDPNFVNTILLDSISEELHYGESILYYNALDGGLSYETIGATNIRAIKWSGLLLAPGTVNIRFTVSSVGGGVRLTLDGNLQVDELDQDDVHATFDVGMVDGVTQALLIEYTPSVLAASFSLKWAFPTLTDTPFPLHANLLLAPLHTLPATELITVEPAMLGNRCQAWFPAVIMQNEVTTFTLESRDSFGNLIPEQSSCLNGETSSPECLFDIYFDPLDPSVSFDVSFTSNGIYSVDFTMTTDGPKQVYIAVITGPGSTDRDIILSAPISIVVTPNR